MNMIYIKEKFGNLNKQSNFTGDSRSFIGRNNNISPKIEYKFQITSDFMTCTFIYYRRK